MNDMSCPGNIRRRSHGHPPPHLRLDRRQRRLQGRHVGRPHRQLGLELRVVRLEAELHRPVLQARDVAQHLVRPALADTEGMDRLAPKGVGEAVDEGVPMQRMGKKSDIASAGVYLFSDAATFITGTQMVVDGGAWQVQGPMLPYPTTSLDPKSLSSLVSGSRL